ncbi:hypothetical protein LC605_17485 [Nostoc sp. CHAB 5836]|uniref:hypothetical protein n=1 Tax=Nostoc sp. CHAB 5836 TaxID=2780404 RepID=UPI001E3808F7|nr:hypothetical protein [Nostoc sp. CHAB 5836]MCC5616835.1 hypothetical protein [Nostoc sp. CHAB 5836]
MAFEERNPTEERGLLGNTKVQPNLQLSTKPSVLDYNDAIAMIGKRVRGSVFQILTAIHQTLDKTGQPVPV